MRLTTTPTLCTSDTGRTPSYDERIGGRSGGGSQTRPTTAVIASGSSLVIAADAVVFGALEQVCADIVP